MPLQYTNIYRSLLATFLFCLGSTPVLSNINRDYTYLYFENGYPMRQSFLGNANARSNPDLVVQTGYYSLRLECDTLELTGYNSLTGTNYISALTQDVSTFTPATLNLYAYVGNKRYTCNSAIVQDSSDEMYVRLIESNRYVQRFDHTGLVFTASDGSQLSARGRLEVTAWSDHVTFKLDLENISSVTRTTIQVISPSGTQHLVDTSSRTTSIAFSPHTNNSYAPLNASSYITSAIKDATGASLAKSYDSDEAALKISVPADSVSYPADKDRVDEYTITLTNPTSSAKDVPLIFDQPSVRAVTGTVMLLANADDNTPYGIPIHISKNWHKSLTTVHMGTWLRGYTMIPLVAGESRTLRLRVVYGYWGGGDFGAVSHANLSLVGWSPKANWKWDESALGAWGEALTYDPTRHAGRAHLADIRPTFTTGLSGGSHQWTENAGGGNFLLYYDNSNTFRFSKRMKTCYNWIGPNITEVLYTGVTDDDKIRYTNTVRSVATLDYHRKFHKFKYEFLSNVTSPTRLLFYQMAADNYTGSVFTDYYRGWTGGLMSTYTSSPGENTYKGSAMFFRDRWLSIDDTTTNGGDTSYAHRGILAMDSTLNDSPFNLYMHRYGRSWGADKMLFDLSAQSVSRSYNSGDVVEGEVAFIMPAKSSAHYWGGDAEFASRLGTYSADWNAVHDEYRYNRNLSVSMSKGTKTNNYPLEITAANGSVLADFTINSGGIGHVPVILNNVSDGVALHVERFSNGAWVDYELASSGDHDYYQGYYNTSGSLDYAFSIKRPTTDLSASWRIRITGVTADYTYEGEDYTSTSGCSIKSSNSGFSGSGYADMGGNGSYFEWDNVAGGTGGSRTLSFRYAIGSSANRNCTVSINGITAGTVSFPTTSGWSNWQDASITLDLPSGENVVRLTASTSAGGPNVDFMDALVNDVAITKKQAESYTTISGCSVKSSGSGFDGSGFVDMGGNGSYFEWNNINGGSYGGLTSLDFRYALGSSANRPCNISVNGVIVGTVTFATTGGWSSWASDSIPVLLGSGNNTVRVSASSSAGGPNIDKVE